MLTLREAAHDHTSVRSESRVVFYRVPRRAIPNRAPKFLQIILPEELGLDARCIVCGWNGWFVGILIREGNSNRIGRLHLTPFGENVLQVGLRLGIPLAISCIFILVRGCLCILGFFCLIAFSTPTFFALVPVLPTVLIMIFAPILMPMPLMPMAVPIPMVVRPLRSLVLVLPMGS